MSPSLTLLKKKVATAKQNLGMTYDSKFYLSLVFPYLVPQFTKVPIQGRAGLASLGWRVENFHSLAFEWSYNHTKMTNAHHQAGMLSENSTLCKLRLTCTGQVFLVANIAN